MSEHDEILEGFRCFAQAREVFAKYEKRWFSGNDNHIGDVGEYWTMRYFADKEPILAPSRISPWDIQLKDGKKLSIKTMSEWNRSGRGGSVKGIDEKHWDYLVAVKLNRNLEVEKFCVVPHHIVQERIKNESAFKWWDWLKDYEIEYPKI